MKEKQARGVGSSKSVKEQAELTEQLIFWTHQKNRGIKRLIWGVVLGIFNLAVDGLYNTTRFLIARGDLKTSWILCLARFLESNFTLLFIIWFLLWIASLTLVISGLIKWLTARGEIERIKLELD